MTATFRFVSMSATLPLVGLAACDPTPRPPTEAEARRMIEFAFRAGAGRMVGVKSFSQTGGRRYGTAFGAPHYALTWHAELEFLDHAFWCYPFTVHPYDRKNLRLVGAKEVQRYDSGFVDGSITFIYNEYADKGWQLEDTKYSDTSRVCR